MTDPRPSPPPLLTPEQWQDPHLDYVMGRRILAQLSQAADIHTALGGKDTAADLRAKLVEAIALWPGPARELGLLSDQPADAKGNQPQEGN